MDYSKLEDFSAAGGDFNQKRYKQGQWGSGSYSTQQLAEKFGLDTSAAENNGATAVWGMDRSGKRTFLGNADNSYRSDSEVLKAHSLQAHPDESKHDSELSSNGDMIGAMLALWDGAADKEAPKETKAPVPDSMKRLPDQVINSRNTIEDFNNNYSNIWKGTEDAGASKAFMKDYSFAGSEKLPATGGVDVGRESVSDIAPVNRSSVSNYRTAKDKAQAFSYQQNNDAMGMP